MTHHTIFDRLEELDDNALASLLQRDSPTCRSLADELDTTPAQIALYAWEESSTRDMNRDTF